MQPIKSSDETLISAMRILARDIQSEDGVANSAISEAADRLESLKQEIKDLHISFGCELRDPAGTIWDFAAKMREALVEIRDIKKINAGYRTCSAIARKAIGDH